MSDRSNFLKRISSNHVRPVSLRASPLLDIPKLVLDTRHTIEGGEMPNQLPKHVKEYLDDMKVLESDLPQEALDTFASLSGGEIAILRKLGETLKDVDQGTIVKVH